MTDSQVTVGGLIARLLAHWRVRKTFGVISIHNMPILDPLGEHGDVGFVAARGEAGAVNMADAYARVIGGLGVAFTSTGTAAGNAAGALVEALTAGSPVLHITGQIELEHLGKDRAYIHEAPAQLDMLKAVCKGAFQILSVDDALPVMLEAAELALSAPTGPVSVEIPVDIQAALMAMPSDLPDLKPTTLTPSKESLDALAERLKAAKRPVLLLGGGARLCGAEATALADLGVCIVTSTNGRAVVPEDHPSTLGAFNCTAQVQALYDSCDLMIAVGTRLRGNETWSYKLRLPSPLAVIDVNPAADGRCYPVDQFVEGDSRLSLAGVLERVGGALDIDPNFAAEIASARDAMTTELRAGLGPYVGIVDAVQANLPIGAAWVRDVTISNSTWGNRMLKIDHPRAGVHAVGGGIGQGLPMAIGAAFASPAGAIVLSGDGGLNLCIGEIATAADEQAPFVMVLMNDAGYGVIRNIQDVAYGGRKHFSNILVPDYAKVADSVGLAHERVSTIEDFAPALARALALKAPAIVEVDMTQIGPIPLKFAGPPKKTA